MNLIRSIYRGWKTRRRPTAKASHENVFAYAQRIARDLETVREELARQGRADLCQRIDRDLDGFPPRAVVPAYRRVAAHLEGEISDGTRSIPLPAPTATERPLSIDVGLRRLRELPALAQAVDAGADHFLLEMQPPFDLAYGRTLYPQWRGWKITRLWHRVPVREIEAMVLRIGTQGQELRQAGAKERG